MTARDPFLDLVLPELDRLLATAASADAGLLAALSGGADSVALLRAAVARREAGGGTVEAAHLNHGLRGEASDADQAFCEALCASLDVPLHVRRADPRDLGGNLEAAGRELRRAFFAETLDAAPHLGAVATGHHRDDQLETLVLRFFRGTGPAGLRGILPVDGRTIHPLLAAGRADVVAYLERLGQDWREDPTNIGGDNARARLRAEALPLLRDILGPGVDAAPLRLAELLAADESVLAAAAGAGLAEFDDGAPGLPVDALLAAPQPLATRIVRHVLRDLGLRIDLARAHLDRLFAWLPESRSGAAVDLVGGWTARREFARVVFVPPVGETGLSPSRDVRILVEPAAAGDLARPEPAAGAGVSGSGPWRLTLPAEALRGAPRARPWRPGDRLVPLGMTGRKKVSDLLREHRVPVSEREGILLVEDDAGPLWLVGVVRAERTRLLPSHTEAVTLLVHEESRH